MRIVQTFWTASKSLLENEFGWPHPQYHLMSWALTDKGILKEGEYGMILDYEGHREELQNGTISYVTRPGHRDDDPVKIYIYDKNGVSKKIDFNVR